MSPREPRDSASGRDATKPSVRKRRKASPASSDVDTATGRSVATSIASIAPAADDRAARVANGEPRIVCLGASAGGLEALEAFFKAIPADTGAAFVAILHLAGDFKNVMAELLARYTKMTIEPVVSGTHLEPNTVYVIPPNKNLLHEGGRLLLQDQDRSYGRGVNFPIDVFLESLARDRASDAIALILSGTGTDGSRGIRALKAAGGVVLVQDPESAKFDGMPRSALQTDVHDGIGPAGRLADKVTELLRRRAAPPADLDDAVVAGALDALRHHFNVDLGYMRPPMVRRRIERRMLLLGSGNLDEYAARLQTDRDEARALRQDLFIGVTSFFRDREAYEATRRQLLRYLSGLRSGDQFRAWVPACATGEEAYSMAILLTEAMQTSGLDLDVKIFATDIDEEALAQATRARYPISNAKDLTTTQLVQFFQNDGDALIVRPHVRELVICARHDLVSDPPFTRLDLVSCRNFLVHVTPQYQADVLGNLHFSLKQDGLLLLGSSEALGELSNEFDAADAGQRLFRKTSPRAGMPPGMRRRSDGAARVGDRSARPEPDRDDGLRQLFELLAEERGSTIVTVNFEGALQEVIADELGVFRVPKGKPTTDLLRMVSKELVGPLRMAWHRAKSGEDTINYLAEFPAKSGRRVALSARRVPATAAAAERIAITIEPALVPIDVGAPRLDGDSAAAGDQPLRDLQQTRENLQASIEELEAAHRDHQATKQDLMATTEELQSTSEELVTVSVEHEKKVKELAGLTSDLDNLLRNVNVGTLFLDGQLRLRRFTSGMEEVLKVMDRDVGRPFEHVPHQFGADFIDALKHVVGTGAVHERQVRSPQGKWLLVRALPYLTAAGATGGVVITTMDVTAFVNAQQLTKLSSSQLADVNKELTCRGEELEDLFSIVAHDLKRPVIALDGLLQLATDDLTLSLDDTRTFLAQAKTECARMKRMLEDLAELSSSTRREITLQDVDLQPWLDSVLQRFAGLAQQRNVRLTSACDPAKLTLPQSALEEAVENLVENAFKYGCTDASPRIDVSCRVSKGVLELNVMDNGKGIPRESHEKVFEPFRRLEPDVADGSGMGLVAVRRAIGRHSGVVMIDAQVERGTKFIVRLPLGGAPLDPETVGSKRRVLVVEDDALDYKMIERMLGDDFHVTRAHQLTDAELRLTEELFHMVLLDLSLPDGHGLELVKRMRSLLDRPVPVIVVTGHGEGINNDSLATGLVSGWVSKAQLTKETLQQSMERALAA